jgi:hypothetical protein
MRWLLAWALFFAGDAVSRVQSLLPDHWRIQAWLYRYAYNPLMGLSSRVQGSGRGPWRDA